MSTEHLSSVLLRLSEHTLGCLELKLFDYINPKVVHVENFFFFPPHKLLEMDCTDSGKQFNLFVNLNWDLCNFTPHFILNLISFKAIKKV